MLAIVLYARRSSMVNPSFRRIGCVVFEWKRGGGGIFSLPLSYPDDDNDLIMNYTTRPHTPTNAINTTKSSPVTVFFLCPNNGWIVDLTRLTCVLLRCLADTHRLREDYLGCKDEQNEDGLIHERHAADGPRRHHQSRSVYGNVYTQKVDCFSVVSFPRRRFWCMRNGNTPRACVRYVCVPRSIRIHIQSRPRRRVRWESANHSQRHRETSAVTVRGKKANWNSWITLRVFWVANLAKALLFSRKVTQGSI